MRHDPELLASYDYVLPEERIAQVPSAARGGARMLTVAADGAMADSAVSALAEHLRPKDLLIFNDTRVRAARLEGVRCTTGGRAELLLLDHDEAVVRGLLKTRGTPQVGEEFRFGDGALPLRHLRDLGDGLHELAHFAAGQFPELLERHGRMPLPPYIARERGSDPRDALDRERYQTCFARSSGAAAAPTAGLHFTPDLMQALQQRGVAHAFVTLHVGLGTFKPVTAQRLEDHIMHAEAYTIPAATVQAIQDCRAAGGRVVAVGTTALRALESAARSLEGMHAHSGTTRLFLRPRTEFRCVDLLFTNFHAPRSTLLVLVAAWCGCERILAAYDYALNSGYRFLSYGDACLLERAAD